MGIDDGARPCVGISSCLLGQKVRYNGADKRDAVLLDALRERVEWVPVCPEVEVGMGTPREPVQLVRTAGAIRMLTVHSRVDHTPAMREWAEQRLDELARLGLAGYVLKKHSPSCGRESVPVFSADGRTLEAGSGLFAEALIRRFPGLPIEEEDALHDAAAIARFLARIREYRRRNSG
jgi:uncharacterized protein YbbK (DUF523 family)